MTSNRDNASLILRLKGIAFQDEAKAVTVRAEDLRAVLGLLSQETASVPNFDKTWAGTGYNYGEDALSNVRIGWDLALAQLRSIAPRLDAPARIGATTFGKGVMWSTVVRRAQEEFRWGRQRPTVVLTEDEHHWLDYAVCHMEDDSEPEDKTCAEVLRGLLARCVVPFDPAGFAERNPHYFQKALETIAGETSATSPTEAADRFQSIAREALKKTDGDEALAPVADDRVAGDLYRNACDSLEEWKTRAMDLEETLERLHAQHNAENGPTFMGEPVLPTYKRLSDELQARKCKTCKGLGVCDDLEPGDTACRTWTCEDCGGSGLAPTKHDLYKTGDADAPDVIQDRNGEVGLGLCRRCGQGEGDLADTCPAGPRNPTDSAGYTLGPVSDGGMDPREREAEVASDYDIDERGHRIWGTERPAQPVEAVSESDAELKRLVDYFNKPGVFSAFGAEGDLEGWSMVETAIKNLERFREARPGLRHHARVIELLRPFAAAYHRLRYFGANPTASEHLYAGLAPAYELLNGVEGAPLTVDLLRIAAELLDEKDAT